MDRNLLGRLTPAGLAGTLLLALALLIPAPRARANFVYWTSGSPNSSIARAKLNGTGLNTKYIAGLNSPHGVATDSRFVYWTQGDALNGSIGRANLNGTGANQEFIPHTAGVGDPSGIAVTPTAIYWQNGGGSIARANVDGTGTNPSFIGTTNSNCGLAADSNFLYYLNNGGTQIGRATLDGSSVTPNFASIPEAFCGLAVDVNYLYWASDGGNTVGRIPVGGGAPEADFIDAGTTSGGPSGVAVNPQFVFWGNYDNDVIGRANVNGTGRNPTLIGSAGVTGPLDASQLAAAPPNKITINSVIRNRRKGTATIIARFASGGLVTLDQVSTPSDVTASAAAVKEIAMTNERAGIFALPVKPRGKTARRIKRQLQKRRTAKVRVTVFIHLVPAGVAGVPNTEQVSIMLIKRGKKVSGKK